MATTEDIALMSTDEGQEFSKSLQSLEKTMQVHLETLRRKRNAEPQGQDDKLVPAAPKAVVRSYSSLKKDGNTAASKTGPTRPDKVTVQVRIILLKVGDVDTLRDKFTADAFIQAKWREPLMDGRFKLQNEPINWDLYWNPRLWMENQLGDPKESVWHSITFDANGQATICEKRRVYGSFMEFMELNEFPFDNQDLTVTVTTDRDQSELELIEDPKERCSLNVDSFVDEQEWKIHRNLNVWNKIRTDSLKNSKLKHPSLSAAARTSRKPQFFIWNVFLVMCLICSLSFTTFAVQLNLPQNRLQLTFILLLTTISFKFIVNQSLPMIAYLTFLDKYILGSMSILASTCVWHAVISFVYAKHQCIGTTTLRWVDLIAFGILGSIYVAFHIIFFCILFCRMRQNGTSDANQPGAFSDEEVNDGFDDSDMDVGGPDLVMANQDWRQTRRNQEIQNNGSAQHEVIQALAGLDS